MDAVLLARLQFALTIGFHYLYPPLSIGLGLVLVLLEAMYLKTRDALYRTAARFWTKIFALIFALGVATGIVMEFEFGTNWAAYSRFVGDVFGSPLAAEGILAFFLESTFLGVLLFGWDRVGPKMHFFSTVMVALGATLSAFWIVAANSWMQTPAGFRLVGEGAAARAEITDFWAMAFNPSTWDRFSHVITGCWQAGAWLVISVSAFYLLINKHAEFSKASLKIGLVIALASSVGQLMTGHMSAVTVSRYQPAKLAAFEGHFTASGTAPLNLLGWVDEKNEKVRFAVGIPNALSLLVHGDPGKPVQGLKAFQPGERPPVNIVFQTYHLMIAIGMGLIGLTLLAFFFWWRGILFQTRWLLALLALGVFGPQIANQAGWITAEVGRQPWIVYGLLKTSDAVSKAVSANEILFSLVLFTFVYAFLFACFLYLLIHKIRQGPVE